jgi:hypothetical protein
MANAASLISDRIELPGSIEEISESYYQRGWTDGLPIVPPTEDRVEKMLSGTTQKPQDLVGEVPPSNGEATVEKIAINAVMAGCTSQYMPVLITALEAMLEPKFNLYGIQATTHPVAPLIIVNGPIRKKLAINSGYNVFGQGTKANATIGRAIRLILINVGGAVHGKLDRSTQGQPSKYSFCIAENEEKNPWQPLHVERGFDPSASTVTVLAAENPHNINDHSSIDAQGILTTVVGTMKTQGSNNILNQSGEVLLTLGPEHASTIAKSGFSKEDIKRFIFMNARLSISDFPLGHQEDRFPNFKSDAFIPVAYGEKAIMVIVAGGAGKHSSFCPNFGHSVSITKKIEA